MNKAEKERQERRRRMLAREQGHTSTKPVPGTSGDIGLRTPQPVRREENRTAREAESAANLRSITPLLKQRQRRRTIAVGIVILAVALAFAVFTGAMSASIALLADGVDSLSLYLSRGDGGWPVDTGISEPLQIEELAGGFVELDAEDVVVYSAYGSQVRRFQPGYARPVLAAVDENDLDPDELQQRHIPHDELFQRVVRHGVPAVLDDENFILVFFDVRHRFQKEFRLRLFSYHVL